ncbi:MAG: hypothetical protein HY400_06530, partial [Elusimicrobia bacterium]|nr:hypothetical protein [Elusimicrobiota bacterium]
GVEAQISVTPGAQQYAQQAEVLFGAMQELQRRRGEVESSAAGLEEAYQKSLGELEKAVSDKKKAHSEELGLAEDAHKLGWRIGKEGARLEEAARLQEQIRYLRNRLAFEQAYLKYLEGLLKEKEKDRQKPPPENQWNRKSVWKWIFIGLGLGLVFYVVWKILTRKKKGG